MVSNLHHKHVLYYITCVIVNSSANFYYNDMTLYSIVFQVNRHGERTPAEEEAALSDDQDRLNKAIGIDGYEALTHVSV